ncbi:hypothetical protein BDR05DRAFT_1063366 [Suillus weaverae]|nr:hypothetical protein BDR05DRAFT_1063366 [Suillus weaverae]
MAAPMSRPSSDGITRIAAINTTPFSSSNNLARVSPYSYTSSLASPSKMIASGKMSFATDGAVKNAEDAKYSEPEVFQTSAVEGVIVKKIVVGPFEARPTTQVP